MAAPPSTTLPADLEEVSVIRRLHRLKVEGEQKEVSATVDPLAPPPMLFTTSSAKRFHDLVESAADRWSRPYVPDFSDWDAFDTCPTVCDV